MVANLVETDADGFIVVNPFHETSTPGLYAAGDVSTIYSEQVLTAIGDGARAAMSAYDYVLSERLLARSAHRCVSDQSGGRDEGQRTVVETSPQVAVPFQALSR